MSEAKHLLTRPGVKVMGHRMDFPPLDLPLFVSVPIAVKSPNGGRCDWRKHHFGVVRKQRESVHGALLARYGNRRPTLPVVVTLTRRIPKGGREFDSDNLVAAFKVCRDQVAEWLGTNDGPNGGVEWRYEQVRDPESTMGTTGITIDTPHGGREQT
jgi:hypothetical protein